MKIAVSGSHSTGKSTLVAAFAAQRPHFVCEPEAYEILADEITLMPSEGPDVESLAALIEYTASMIADHRADSSVIFERSPVDYLAYAAASRSITASEREDLFSAQIPAIRDAVRELDLVVLLPVSSQGPIASRPGDDEAFRERVDDELRRALLDDDYDLFGDPDAPLVVELSPDPDRQLAELLRRA